MQCKLCENPACQFETDQLRRGAGKVYYCAKCDLAFLDSSETSIPEQRYKDEYWKSVGPNLSNASSYEEIFNSYVNYQHHRLKTLQPYFNKEARLLEVGCATGHFLFNAKEHFKEIVGIDFDEDALAYASNKVGCLTYAGGIEAAARKLEPKSFNVICCFQTLEHAPDPIAFMKALSTLLADGGIVYIEVPNLYDPLLGLYEVPAYKNFYYHSDHIFYFSENSLLYVMKNSGFEGDIHFYQDYNLTNHLHWIYLNRPQESCEQGLGKASLPLLDGLTSEVREKYKEFIRGMDSHYKEFLASIKKTDNLAFIGKLEPTHVK